MTTIATLGPANTFSELAARKYGKENGGEFSVVLYPTIGKAFAAVGEKCSCAVLPIENMAEGYVSIVLDLLVHSDLSIVHELLLPIQFTLAANCSSRDQVEKVYAQFVSQGQCESFLDNMENIMSRPTKEMLGRYHFFIDVEGHSEEHHIMEALSEIEKENTIRVLGSYAIARPVFEMLADAEDDGGC